MNTFCRKILITLFLSALPAMTTAAETAPSGPMTAVPAQPAPATASVSGEKGSDPPKLQPPAIVAPPKNGETAVSKPAIRIGHVDLLRISTDSEPGKAGQSLLTNRKKKLQTQIETKRKQLDKQRAAIEAKLSSYTPQQKEARAREFQKKVEEYQKSLQKADMELQELQQEQSRILYEKIEQASAAYAKANGLAAVTVKRDMLYQADGVDAQDITEGIVKLVNEQGNKK